MPDGDNNGLKSVELGRKGNIFNSVTGEMVLKKATATRKDSQWNKAMFRYMAHVKVTSAWTSYTAIILVF